MPSPDLSDLNDLLLYDQTPSDLVDRALLDAAVKMPGYDPVPGDTSLVLLEALSLVTAELGYAINRLPDGVLDILLRLYGITRSVGTSPTTTVTFSSTTGNPLTIPAGTSLLLVPAAGDPVEFLTDTAATGPGPTLTVAATASSYTSAVNGTPAGTPLQVQTQLPDIDSAATASTVGGGSDPEDTPTWRARGSLRFARLNSTLVKPEHFVAAAEETPGVSRATALDNNNAGTTAAGHITVPVVAAGGALLSGGAKTTLQASLSSQAQANLAVHVVDATLTPVDVTATVHPLDGYTGDVVANVNAALAAYLNADSWPWNATVRRTKLMQVIENAEGVDYLDTLSAPASDVTLSGVGPLATLGTPLVTTV